MAVITWEKAFEEGDDTSSFPGVTVSVGDSEPAVVRNITVSNELDNTFNEGDRVTVRSGGETYNARIRFR